MAYVMIWSPLDRFLWGIVCILSLFCALQYLSLAKKREDRNVKLISIGFAGMFIGFTVYSLLILIIESLIPGRFVNGIFYGNYDQAFANRNYRLIWKLCNFSFYAGLLFFFFAFESVTKRTKYTITGFWCIALFLILVLPFDYVYFLTVNIVNSIAFILVLGIMLYYLRSSRRELKALYMFLLMGFLLVVIGVTFVDIATKKLNFAPLFLGPSF
jgi:hypothetical protein